MLVQKILSCSFLAVLPVARHSLEYSVYFPPCLSEWTPLCVVRLTRQREFEKREIKTPVGLNRSRMIVDTSAVTQVIRRTNVIISCRTRSSDVGLPTLGEQNEWAEI